MNAYAWFYPHRHAYVHIYLVVFKIQQQLMGVLMERNHTHDHFDGYVLFWLSLDLNIVTTTSINDS